MTIFLFVKDLIKVDTFESQMYVNVGYLYQEV